MRPLINGENAVIKAGSPIEFAKSLIVFSESRISIGSSHFSASHYIEGLFN